MKPTKKITVPAKAGKITVPAKAGKIAATKAGKIAATKEEAKERAPRASLYPTSVATATAEKAEGVYVNRHGVWVTPPKDSQLGAIPFVKTHSVREYATGKQVEAMLTRDERETYDTACVVKIGNVLSQGYVAKNSGRQPRKFAEKDGTKGQKPDVARWESASSGFVAIGKAAKVPLYFVS